MNCWTFFTTVFDFVNENKILPKTSAINSYDYEEFVAFDEAARKEYAQSRI
mgnify:CR=1 FL=1